MEAEKILGRLDELERLLRDEPQADYRAFAASRKGFESFLETYGETVKSPIMGLCQDSTIQAFWKADSGSALRVDFGSEEVSYGLLLVTDSGRLSFQSGSGAYPIVIPLLLDDLATELMLSKEF